ncbi:MAG: hypothetical protein AAFN30_21150 [Actinomycetota bacterium]
MRPSFPSAVAALGLALAACGGGVDAASTTSSEPRPSSTTETTSASTSTEAATSAPSTTSAEPTTTAGSGTESTPTSDAPTTSTTAASDESGQDQPTINGWSLEVSSQPCEESDLPGGPGGEAVVPAVWAAGNADFVEFVVDGDRRPANMVREVAGPGNVQVPCDPALNDGHEITIVAYTGSPGDAGPGVVGETHIVITTATVDPAG